MSYLKEKVAYLKGLAEGMQLNEATNEGKLLKAILEVMDDFALSMDEMEEIQEEMSEQIDNIDEDLADVEKILLDDEDLDDDDDDDDDEEIYYKEIKCPHCHEKIDVDLDALGDEGTVIKCPSCNKEIELEWECCCEDCEDEDK